jgi:hypothetical protein
LWIDAAFDACRFALRFMLAMLLSTGSCVLVANDCLKSA